MSSPMNALSPEPGSRAEDLAEELNDPRPAPPAQEPSKGTGATASERAAAQTAAELSGR